LPETATAGIPREAGRKGLAEEDVVKLYIYLNFGGNCEPAFRSYEKHLGGKISMMMTHAQQPNPENVPPEWKNAILHARMNIGETELMGADVPPERFQPMRSAYLSLLLESAEEAERIYAVLADSGEIFMQCRRLFSPSASQCTVIGSAPTGCSSTSVRGRNLANQVAESRS
jgi:PhnB protein